jgi:hypothetical protein
MFRIGQLRGAYWESIGGSVASGAIGIFTNMLLANGASSVLQQETYGVGQNAGPF